MEGIREISRSYYEKASEEEKNSVKEYFNKLDINRDGKISMEEIKKCITSLLSTEDVFKQLDMDGNETLDFDEVLCLYYMERKLSIVRCSECFQLLAGSYFSCVLCLGKTPDTYDLCCDCFRGGKSSHEHSSECMLDHHSLVRVLRERTAAQEKSRRKKEMEELREIAKAYYEVASPQVQSLAYQFYQSMDTNGDGWINLSEFLSFMRQEGYSHMHDPYFFSELDRDGNGTLDFFEVMTLFYIIKSGRPFCGCCFKFIPGIFFSCVECFACSETSPFHICGDCYRSSKCNHNHNGRAHFLDNYALLQIRRDPILACTSVLNYKNDSNAMVPAVPHEYGNMRVYNFYEASQYPTTSYVGHLQNQTPNYYTALMLPSSKDHQRNWKRKAALKALEIAINVGAVASSAAACTIM